MTYVSAAKAAANGPPGILSSGLGTKKSRPPTGTGIEFTNPNGPTYFASLASALTMRIP